jgi:L-seryl-tRNA(Ser) seleniumtransferase
LILSHFCKAVPPRPKRRASHRGKNRAQGPKNEVIISRGELIQIGGGFRIPEILESSGARLREVGTTNKTSLDDYARAVGRDTALILKVHRSNFYMGGFVESPRTDEIAKLARKIRIPFVEDLGSGAIMNTQSIAGLEHEPTPADLMRSGLDLICFSADKLFGGPQAGIIAGSAGKIAALKQEPIFRAFRCDKLIISALEATADLYLRNSHNAPSLLEPGVKKQLARDRTAAVPGIPVVEMLHVSSNELRARADKIVCALRESLISAVAGTGTAQVGGGTLPRSVLPSITVDLTHNRFKAQELAARLRERSLPIIGYVARGTLKLDLRTIFPRQDAELVKALQEL